MRDLISDVWEIVYPYVIFVFFCGLGYFTYCAYMNPWLLLWPLGIGFLWSLIQDHRAGKQVHLGGLLLIASMFRGVD